MRTNLLISLAPIAAIISYCIRQLWKKHRPSNGMERFRIGKRP
jgi:hypothetical protein